MDNMLLQKLSKLSKDQTANLLIYFEFIFND